MIDYKEFQCELQILFEKYELHGTMIIPHYIMVKYLTDCMMAFDGALNLIEAKNANERMKAAECCDDS